MRRVLSVWLTDWPLDRRARMLGGRESRSAAPDEPPSALPPFALTERIATGVRVVAADAAASAFGVAPGLRLADARARAPGLLSEEIDRAADAAALERLARWMTRWSPAVAVDGRDGVLLDVTGCAHLWGGESGLMADVSARLDRLGLRHRLGLAATPGAAWALAHTASGQITRLEGDLGTGLGDLPVAGLRLGEEALTLLRRFGLTRIGQLAGIGRAALARRFQSAEAADRVLLRLDQAMGRIAEPLRPLEPLPEHSARVPCPEPLIDQAGLEAAIARLVADLATGLETAGLGTRHLRLIAYRSDGTRAEREARAARPSRDPAHLARLLTDRLEGLDPGFGIDLVRLEAGALGSVEMAAPPLRGAGAGEAQDPAALAALADRMASRLGAELVTTALPQESHLPERTEQRRAFAGSLPDWTDAVEAPPEHDGLRPPALFDRPEPVEVVAEIPDGPPMRFVWRRVPRRVVRAEGPERIGPEWWRAQPGGDAGTSARARDYYRVEDRDGRRYWLYREGLYEDGQATLPRWYLHGLFG